METHCCHSVNFFLLELENIITGTLRSAAGKSGFSWHHSIFNGVLGSILKYSVKYVNKNTIKVYI